MNRNELDAFAAHYGLSADAVGSALDLVGARPTGAEMRRFGVRLLGISGVLSIAAGVVFFVAANWAALGIFGRFALVEGALFATVAVALWRPPPRVTGRYALLLAFIVSGALFALFGQTYQTGADVYELFLNWSLLGLALVVAAQWSVVWAAWTLVLNVALVLYCAARPQAGLFWMVLSGWDLRLSHLLLGPLAVNAVLWLTTVALEDTPWSHLAPAWLGRFLLACAVAYGTWAGMIVVLDFEGPGGAFLGLLVPIVVFAGIAWHTMRRREDVFPLALIEASLIILSTTWIVEVGRFEELAMPFVVAAWLVVSSTVSGRWLMHLVRTWDIAESRA